MPGSPLPAGMTFGFDLKNLTSNILVGYLMGIGDINGKK
jgi:hypothetical protein